MFAFKQVSLVALLLASAHAAPQLLDSFENSLEIKEEKEYINVRKTKSLPKINSNRGILQKDNSKQELISKCDNLWKLVET